jgi:Ca2+-binding EF-hand superfamily protein
MKTIVTLTAASLAAASFLVLADPGSHAGGRGQERLHAADTNGDGQISRQEAAALPRLAKNFDAIDANKDGQVTREEMRAYHEQQRGAHWKRLDTDGDGRISKAEAQANAPRLFEHFTQVDANGDGFVTPEEMKAARRHHAHGPK